MFQGRRAERPTGTTRFTPSREHEVKGLMQAFVDRSASIEAMWVVNAEGRLLYTSVEGERDKTPISEQRLGPAPPRRDGDRFQDSKAKYDLLRYLGAVADAQRRAQPGRFAALGQSR